MVADLRDRIGRAIAAPAAPSSDYDLAEGLSSPDGRVLRPAAVLVGLVLDDGPPRLILTKRSSRLRHHPGQIAFPGGKQDPGDPTLEDAALREAEEEVGLPRSSVTLLGRLPVHETVTGYAMTPVVGIVARGFVPRPEAGEVAEAFTVPLAAVLDPANYRIERRQWLRQWRAYWVVPWGPYYIWGATACVLQGFARRFAQTDVGGGGAA